LWASLPSRSLALGLHVTLHCEVRLIETLDYSFYSWAGVRLNPLGTSATLGLIVLAPNDDDCESGAAGGMGIGRGN
jgi:hypothetical protein